MKKITIAATAALALALTGVGVSAAMAATPAPTPGVSTTEPTTEAPSTEAATPNDGPGGHADAEGVDVNNEGGASEL